MLGVFLDIETSGLDPFLHDPLEIALIIVDLLHGKELGRYESVLQVTREEWTRRDPSSIEINKITLEELVKGKPREQVGREIEELLFHHSINNKRAFFICQNPSFDRPFFSKIIPQPRQQALDLPYHWLDLASMYFAERLIFEQRTQEFALGISKDAIAKSLSLAPEQRPHRAMNGVLHLLLCYTSLLGFPGRKAAIY